MKRITDTTTTPPGGWVYVEPTTGVEIRDLNYQGLITRIRSHRDAVGLPVHGEWLTEVQQTLIQINPRIPHEEEGVHVRTFNAGDVIQFMEVMKELRGSQLVSVEEQERRANICADCPKNGVMNCKYCGWLAGRITELMGGRKIPRLDRIYKHSCMACGCDLTAKTACPTDVLKAVDEKLGLEPAYDERCWMRES